ncbi:hypothetical protein HK405_011987 [Cladochytrium tenue]|nr:hypothetical protein HK405_011987 [Cladochytrium tenue]
MSTGSQSWATVDTNDDTGPTPVHVVPSPPQGSIAADAAADAAFKSIVRGHFASLSSDLHQPLIDPVLLASAFVSDLSTRAWLGFSPGILTLEGVLAYFRSIFYSVETICARIDGFPESIHKDAKVAWVFTACCCKSTQMYKPPEQDFIAIIKVTAEFANTAASTLTGRTSQPKSPEINSDPVMAIIESKFKPVIVFDQVVNREYSRQDGTRNWLVKEVEDWMADDSGKRVFWLQDVAGSGKSVIYATVTQKFRRAGKLAATFLCNHAITEQSDPRRLLLTLAYQVASMVSAPARERLSRLSVEMIQRESLNALFDRLIVDPLQQFTGDRLKHERIF